LLTQNRVPNGVRPLWKPQEIALLSVSNLYKAVALTNWCTRFRQYKSCKISSTPVRIFHSFCEKRAAAKDDRCYTKKKQIRFTDSRLL